MLVTMTGSSEAVVDTDRSGCEANFAMNASEYPPENVAS